MILDTSTLRGEISRNAWNSSYCTIGLLFYAFDVLCEQFWIHAFKNRITCNVQLKYRLKKLCNQSKSVFNAISIYVVLVNKSHFETCNFFLMFNIDTLKSLCSWVRVGYCSLRVIWLQNILRVLRVSCYNCDIEFSINWYSVDIPFHI